MTAKASLSRIDKPDEVVTFEVPPQRINRSFQTEYSKLAVLATPQPLLYYQQSVSSIVLPNLLLYGTDTGRAIELLESWTKPVAGTLEPPTLKFSFVHLNLTRVKLETAEVIEDMWVGGSQPSRAEVTLTLLLHPEPPAVKTASTKPPEGTNVKLSPQERAKYLAQVETKVKADPKYKYKKGDVITITEDNKVTLNKREIGLLTDFVTLDKKHTEPKGVGQPQVSKPESSSASSTSK